LKAGIPDEMPTGGVDLLELVPVELLGEGSYGVVHRAVHPPTGAQVALKVLRHVGPGALARFKQEFRALADVHHPNLVTLHSLANAGDRWMYSMEYVPGVDLLRWVRLGPRAFEGAEHESEHGAARERHGRLVEALAQMVDGLETLHRSGHLHRDLKPSNVLVTQDARVVILDFGLVGEIHPLARSRRGDPAGSPAYMSPEQAASAPTSPASDWYSVGVILFEAVTGRLPFTGTTASILVQKQTQDAPDVRTLAPDVPEDLATLCMALLARRPDQRPDIARIRHLLGLVARVAPMADMELQVPFVGRGREIEQLDRAMALVRDSAAPVAVRLHAHSGMGKTTLVQQFLRRFAGKRSVMLSSRCHEQEAMPYKGMDGIVDALVHYLRTLTPDERERLVPPHAHLLARVFPVVAHLERTPAADPPPPPDPHELRRVAFGALADILRRIAVRRPLVVAIDDAHFGDADSAAVLRDLIHAAPPLPVLWILAYRDDLPSTGPLLEALEPPSGVQGPDVVDMGLAPLDASEARAVALARLGAPSVATVQAADAIAHDSQGLPLFVVQMAEHARMEKHVSGVSLPQALEWRIGRLTADAHRLLEALALFGRPVEAALAAQAAGAAGQAPTAVAELRARRLLRASRDPDGRPLVEVYHDRIRAHVLDKLDDARARLLHSAWAQILERESNADHETLATHLEGAGRAADAAHALETAAHRAAHALAWDRAAALYRRALLLAPGDARAAQWRHALAGALANAGRSSDAADAYLAAAQEASGSAQVDLRREAAQQLLSSGRMDEGFAVLGQVFARLGVPMPAGPRSALMALAIERARLLLRGTRATEPRAERRDPAMLQRVDACYSAGMGLGGVDSLRGAYFQARALRLALEAGEPWRIARSLAFEAAFQSTRGARKRDRAQALLAQTHALVRRLDDPYLHALCASAEAIAAFHVGRWPAAFEGAEVALNALRSRCTGVSKERVTVGLFALGALAQMGRFDDLAARVRDDLDDAHRRGDRYAATHLRSGLPVLAWLAKDAPEEAERQVERAMVEWQPSAFLLPSFFALLARSEIDLYRGRMEQARDRLQQARSAVRGSMLLTLQVVRILHRDVWGRALLAGVQGSPGPARLLAAARAHGLALLRENVEWAQPLGDRLLAGVALHQGRPAEARVLLESAALGFRALHMAAHAASAELAVAHLLASPTMAARAGQSLQAMGVRAPDRFLAMHLPAPLPQQ
jgi:eukaryotic-like serine/threonine-protein kinase